MEQPLSNRVPVPPAPVVDQPEPLHKSPMPVPPRATIQRLPTFDDDGNERPVLRGQGMHVKAVAPGFYQGDRKVPGDKFEIAGFWKLGSWMECIDPEYQKEHVLAQKAKRQKENTPAVK